MNEYDFSVIIPTLHEEKTIEGTLSSIHKAKDRSKRRVEIIVVDGGSKDKTAKIAEKYAHRVLVSNKRGIGKARNLGAMHANGDILAFLDADVRVPGNFFNEIYDQFTKNNLSGASCRVMPHRESNPSKFERGFYGFWHNLRRFFFKLKPCGTGDNGIIVKKNVFNKVNGFDESLPVIEDLDFVFRASRHGRFAYLKDLTIYETIRRFRDMGTTKFVTIYLYNFFHYIIFRSSKVRDWEPVR